MSLIDSFLNLFIGSSRACSAKSCSLIIEHFKIVGGKKMCSRISTREMPPDSEIVTIEDSQKRRFDILRDTKTGKTLNTNYPVSRRIDIVGITERSFCPESYGEGYISQKISIVANEDKIDQV